MSSKSVKLILVIWAFILGLYGITRYYQLQWNATTSMPQKLWLVAVGNKSLKVDDYVVFRFHDFRMPESADFEYVVKQIGGAVDDKITVKVMDGNAEGMPYPNKKKLIYILQDGMYTVYETLSNNHFTPLTTHDMVIPQGCYFVHGLHHPSFDSRYKEFGLMCDKQIFGKAYPIF